MEEEAMSTRYWCHVCSQMVNPIMQGEMFQCPFCHTEFMETMVTSGTRHIQHVTSHQRHIRFRRLVFETEDCQGERYMHGNRERGRDRVIMINPFTQTITVRSSSDWSIWSLVDYFIGRCFHLLFQQLMEVDPTITRSSSVAISQGSDRESSPKRAIIEWTFLLVGLILEILLLIFEQIASPRKPQYALLAVLVSAGALLVCVIELFYKARKERVTMKRRGLGCWFHYPSSSDKPFYSFTDIFTLTCAISQCIFSTVGYSYFHQHVNNPIKLNIVSIIFMICLAFSRIIKNSNELSLPTRQNNAIVSNTNSTMAISPTEPIQQWLFSIDQLHGIQLYHRQQQQHDL